MTSEPNSIEVDDLSTAIDQHIADGYRLEMIAPADAPSLARLVRQGQHVVVHAARTPSAPMPTSGWVIGRAGMAYRDLIPDRLGGRVIASHIRLHEGGPVPDYVHYHKIGFQMIYCYRGSIRVVYQDQGEPFWLESGDCVLQPPELRHRVLEATAGAEVVEIGSPAYHETWTDHEMQLPNDSFDADRSYGGQRFVRHVLAHTEWERVSETVSVRDLGIAAATNGMRLARVLRIAAEGSHSLIARDHVRFCFVLTGKIAHRGEVFGREQSFVTDERSCEGIYALEDSEILEVLL